MTTTRRPSSGSHADDVEEIRAGIEETRSELGDTVQALAAKTDVKKQAKDAAESARVKVVDAAETAKAKAVVLADRAQENPRVREAVAKVRQRPIPVAVVIGALVAAYVVVRWRRNR